MDKDFKDGGATTGYSLRRLPDVFYTFFGLRHSPVDSGGEVGTSLQ